MDKVRVFSLIVFLMCINCPFPVTSFKGFSLARYSDTLVYESNSNIDINLIGEGFEGDQITDGGALECHTDDTNCCGSSDGMAGGEWYDPDGNVIAANQIGSDNGLYRTRDNMVIRLNRRGAADSLPTGMYRCEIPGAGGVTITRYITLTRGVGLCYNLYSPSNGEITYTPPRAVSPELPNSRRYQGTIATYSCSIGYQLTGGSIQRACVGGIWNGTGSYCGSLDCGPLTDPGNGQVNTSAGTTFGSTAKYTCDTGYELYGLASRTCESTGNWSFTAPTCRIIDCGSLYDYDGQKISTNTTFGSRARYTCNAVTSTCGSDGSWTRSNCYDYYYPVVYSTRVSSCGGCLTILIVGVIAGLWLIISIVIIVVLSVCICKLKKRLKVQDKEQTSADQRETVGVMDGGGAEYEEIDKVMGKRGQPHPPKGNYELTHCAAYGPVSTDNV